MTTRAWTFTDVSLTIANGHTRLAVREASLSVRVHTDNLGAASEFVNGTLEAGGTLIIDCPAGENRLRPGMQGCLRLGVPGGRYTRLDVLLIAPRAITCPAPGQRTYHWEYLVVSRPPADPNALLPSLAPSGQVIWDGEVSVEDFLQQLGASLEDVGDPGTRFTSEGGLRV